MYSSADISLTPRPIYKADGRKIPDVYSNPPELRDALQQKLGRFPLFNFWGPASSIASSRWIARAAMEVVTQFDPTLTLIYLPHLDYGLQKFGPHDARIPAEVALIDEVARELIDFFTARGTRLIILSEYGIEAVTDSLHINRILRQAGLLRVREEEGLELLDPGASSAFAVADHQIAHIYVNDDDRLQAVLDFARSLEGVDLVLDRDGQRAHGLDHPRAGDLVLIAQRGTWFSYDYWLDDDRAPDFARTVDIHRKPGYDPCELFLDPLIPFPGARARIAWTLLRKKLGFRGLMNVIPLDTRLVRGSHGRTDQPPEEMPVLITDVIEPGEEAISCLEVQGVMLKSIGL
jgi:predicted AlkP superfamily pyrophosphatase or phosphodiesterase